MNNFMFQKLMSSQEKKEAEKKESEKDEVSALTGDGVEILDMSDKFFSFSQPAVDKQDSDDSEEEGYTARKNH